LPNILALAGSDENHVMALGGTYYRNLTDGCPIHCIVQKAAKIFHEAGTNSDSSVARETVESSKTGETQS